MRVEILAFISLYQHYNYLQYLQIYSASEDAEESPFVIKFNEKKIERDIDKGPFYCLMEHSNIKNAPQLIGHFAFIEQIYERDRFWLFAKNYNSNLFIGLDKHLKKIALVDALALECQYIADNEEAFLFFLMDSLIYENLGKDIYNESSWIIKFRDRIIERVGGKQYQAYYEALFPIKEESEKVFKLNMIPFNR